MAPYLKIGGPSIVKAASPSLCVAYDTRRFDLGGIRPDIAPWTLYSIPESRERYSILPAQYGKYHNEDLASNGWTRSFSAAFLHLELT